MKKIIYAVVIASAFILNADLVNAQAWDRGTRVLALGMGASQFFHIDNYYYEGTPDARDWYWPVTGQLNFQGEFAIQKYVGLGFTTGLGGRGTLIYGYAGEVNIPMGMIANFHFYQLIADRSGKNIHADKLDIYAGVNLGGGLAFTFYNEGTRVGPGGVAYYHSTTRVVPMAFGGLHAGVRYYFVRRVGVNGELGWGKSLVNIGFVFKI